ncbi:MAG: translation initiation factor IF-2 [Bacteroidetes bacterium]|nr:translation initiation factor IF-2 [Bacteroidota bacterium]
MTEGKAIRLSKVAKELNVGVSTIIDFLATKGHTIANNPNAKIEDDQYKLLLDKYQPDILTKQKKEQALIQAERDRIELFGRDTIAKGADKKVIRDDAPVDETLVVKSNMAPKSMERSHQHVEQKPQVPLEKPKPSVVEKVESPKPEATIVAESRIEAPEIPAEAPKVEAEGPTETNLREGINEQAKEIEIPSEPKQGPPADGKTEPEPRLEPAGEAPQESENKGIRIIGKIDLPQKTPPKGKAKPLETPSSTSSADVPDETKANPAVEAEAPSAQVSPISNEASTDLTEVAAQVEGEKPTDEPTEHKWEDNRIKLSGLTVKGKVDLASFEAKKKKPDEKLDDKKKRPRKRITASKAVSSTDDKEKLVKAGRDSIDKTAPVGQNRPPRTGQGPTQGGGQRPPQGGGQNRGRTQQQSAAPNRRKGAPEVKAPLDDKAIQNQVKETLNRLTSKDVRGAKTKLKKRKRDILRQRAEEEELERELSSKILEVTEFITANELANLMNVSVTQVIMACMALGLMVSINQRIDAETIALVADEFGFQVKFKGIEMDQPSLEEPDTQERIMERAPIVTIMGHVDHGKTSLLDYIRKANVIAGEAGGITQHIGAYEVVLENGKRITFLDTPGHEAFTAMRARGAKVTDIVVVVVAADDRVMPQTKEAIAHAQAAGVPIVFAINKIDRENAAPDVIKQQLADENMLVEEWGGKYQSQDISAKKGLYVDELLEKILLEAEMLELKADAGKRGVGTVIEATLDKGRGIVTTVLVQGGTLRIGDNILAGAHYGKVKAMFNERGKRVAEAGPSTPVQVLGFDGAPSSGERIYVTRNEQEAKEIALDRSQLIREQGIRATKHITLDEIGRRIAVGSFKELKVIVKGDVDGSVEALSDSLLKLSTEEIQVSVIHKGVGQISETDVMLASASDAVIIGFQVRPSLNARNVADREQIEIRLYSIIYDAINDLKAAMEGMLEPTKEEKVVAMAEVREVFKITKVGTIAGCMVTSGKLLRNNKVRIIREGVVRHTGDISTLKRFKDDVKEVASGYECGVQIANYNDLEIGDLIEAFEMVEVKRKLK